MAVVLSSSSCETAAVETRVHINVLGFVQGVGFRWFVARLAKSFEVRGYVRNLFDGTVEIVAEGERGILGDFIREVRIGPSAARVTDLRIEWGDKSNKQGPEHFVGFEIR